jgi:hypothetical protein
MEANKTKAKRGRGRGRGRNDILNACIKAPKRVQLSHSNLLQEKRRNYEDAFKAWVFNMRNKSLLDFDTVVFHSCSMPYIQVCTIEATCSFFDEYRRLCSYKIEGRLVPSEIDCTQCSHSVSYIPPSSQSYMYRLPAKTSFEFK